MAFFTVSSCTTVRYDTAAKSQKELIRFLYTTSSISCTLAAYMSSSAPMRSSIGWMNLARVVVVVVVVVV